MRVISIVLFLSVVLATTSFAGGGHFSIEKRNWPEAATHAVEMRSALLNKAELEMAPGLLYFEGQAVNPTDHPLTLESVEDMFRFSWEDDFGLSPTEMRVEKSKPIDLYDMVHETINKTFSDEATRLRYIKTLVTVFEVRDTDAELNNWQGFVCTMVFAEFGDEAIVYHVVINQSNGNVILISTAAVT